MKNGWDSVQFASHEVVPLAVEAGKVFVPDASVMFQGEYSTQGQDLLINDLDGTVLRVSDYFSFATAPELVAPNGAVIRGDHVARLAGFAEDTRLAQAEGGDAVSASAGRSLENAIGQVETIQGTVTVTGSDGTTVALGEGDLVFENDVVATGSGSTVSITFVDGTIFSLSAGSRMVLDELVFDPNGSDNSGVFSLIEGGFVFIAGAVAPTGGMNVQLPTGTIGIRGTTVEVQILAQAGVSEILVSLLPDPDGSTGAAELRDLNGEPVAIITSTETSWILSPVEGETREIPRESAIQLNDPALQAQAVAAFQSANARVAGGDTFVSQERTSGGGGPADTDGPDPPGEDQDAQQPGQDNGSNTDGNSTNEGNLTPQETAPDAIVPSEDPAEPIDEGQSPEEEGGSETPEIEEGNLQDTDGTVITGLESPVPAAQAQAVLSDGAEGAEAGQIGDSELVTGQLNSSVPLTGASDVESGDPVAEGSEALDPTTGDQEEPLSEPGTPSQTDVAGNTGVSPTDGAETGDPDQDTVANPISEAPTPSVGQGQNDQSGATPSGAAVTFASVEEFGGSLPSISPSGELSSGASGGIGSPSSALGETSIATGLTPVSISIAQSPIAPAGPSSVESNAQPAAAVLNQSDSSAVTPAVVPTSPPPVAANALPVAGADLVGTPEDVAVTVDVLANDSDPEGAPLSVTGVSQG
ncbi:MAG: FecR domain-containing protein, partial [Pseudomonadota bacterium]